jgi:hypothetical protein
MDTVSSPESALGRASRLFYERLPPEAQPREGNRELAVALFWGDTLIDLIRLPGLPAVRIGAGRENDFHVFAPSLGASFRLITSDEHGTSISIPEDSDSFSMSIATPLGRSTSSFGTGFNSA